jgi:hypothetical protein
MTETRPRMAVLHSQSTPLLLSHILIQIDLRNPEQGLDSPAVHSEAFRVTQLLSDQWRLIPTARIRSHHLSWDKLIRKIFVHFGIKFTTDDAELGWVCPALAENLSEQYCHIVDEASFHNAIGALHSQTSCNNRVGKFILALWSPKHQDPIVYHSPRASLPIQEGDTIADVFNSRDNITIPLRSGVDEQVQDDSFALPDLVIDDPMEVSESESSKKDEEFTIDINELVDQFGQEDDQAPQQLENEEEEAFQERLNSWQQAKADEATIR